MIYCYTTKVYKGMIYSYTNVYNGSGCDILLYQRI